MAIKGPFALFLNIDVTSQRAIIHFLIKSLEDSKNQQATKKREQNEAPTHLPVATQEH